MGFFSKKAYSGINKDTTKHIQLDAGAFFKNFDPATDTYATAKAAGKCLGATQGGGEFSAVPTLRTIDVDGAVGRVRGLVDIESWEVSIGATVLETTVETLKLALAAATSETSSTPTGYTAIKGKAGIADSDFIDNIAWVGNISGSDSPMIIVVKNVLNEGGLNYSVTPKGEGKVELKFYAYNDLADYETDAVAPPFEIYYPDIAADASSLSTVKE